MHLYFYKYYIQLGSLGWGGALYKNKRKFYS